MEKLTKMSKTKFDVMLEQIKTKSTVPLIIPPFKAPSNQDIKKALKILGLQSSYKLTLPEFGTKTAKPVPFGYSFLIRASIVFGVSFGVVLFIFFNFLF